MKPILVIHALPFVIPAKAGTHGFPVRQRRCAARALRWVPASAGMTVWDAGMTE